MLTEINKQDILDNFHTLDGFYDAIDNACKYTCNKSCQMLQNIKLYYQTLFDFNTDISLDASNLRHLALSAIERLKLLYKKNALPLFKFLYERIEKNLDYVSSIRKLA